MKRFLFRLETLLRHRVNLEEKERNELFRLFALYQQENKNLASLTDKQQETLKELAEKRSRNCDQREIGWFYSYLDRLRFEMDQVRHRMMRLDKQIQNQKIAVMDASKKKKVLETLKAKKESEFNFAVEKQEQKSIDELVVIRFPRNAH